MDGDSDSNDSQSDEQRQQEPHTLRAGDESRSQSETASGEIKYQAASPDEYALVMAAKREGYELRSRRPNVVVVACDGVEHEFTVLAINEFDSTRKRMSVLVRFPDGSVYLIAKGADSVILPELAHDDGPHEEDFDFADVDVSGEDGAQPAPARANRAERASPSGGATR